VIVDGLASDSSNDSIVTISATQTKTVNGLALNRDSSVIFQQAFLVSEARGSINNWLDGAKKLKSPFGGKRAVALSFSGTSTYGSGTSTWQVWTCSVSFNASNNALTESCSQLFARAGGATTVRAAFDAATLGPFGLWGQKDQKLVVKLVNSAAMSVNSAEGFGVVARYPAN
jgi:hypothetical protein